MKLKSPEGLSNEQKRAYYEVPENRVEYIYGTRGGWKKEEANPVFGAGYGVCFDVSIIKEGEVFKMWFSWRTKVGIGYCESRDGVHWGIPALALAPMPGSPWEADEVNRPSVVKDGGIYKMWYSGQMRPYREDGRSVIGYAESSDGIHWDRARNAPVLEPGGGWEANAIMCPDVMFDREEGVYKMWYSAGSNHEPDAIGYATSPDGLHWAKHRGNPIMTNKPRRPWEQLKVCACNVVKHRGAYYMFYIGHMHEERASIGIAKSHDGYGGWVEHPQNPVIAPDSDDSWDGMSVYKPFALFDGGKWLLWYNGAKYDSEIWADEKIGLACHEGEDLGFTG
jgi:predicted GH43/DUF377 family glycosyl hydrolase